jgi:hypothetical protein
MTITIPIEIQAVLVGLGGAIIGYAIREYRNRVRPFFQITEIAGATKKTSDMIEIGTNVEQKLKNILLIGDEDDVNKTMYLGTLDEMLNRINILVKKWPDSRVLVSQILKSKDDKTISKALSKALLDIMIENMVHMLLIQDKISVIKSPDGQNKSINIDYDGEGELNGTYWISFPSEMIRFGQDYNKKALKKKVTPFIESISAMNKDIIKDVFRQFNDIMEKEYKTAMECQADVKELVDKNSRWTVHGYIANISKSPIVIECDGIIHVHDNRRVKYKESCFLIIENVEIEDEDEVEVKTTPLVVRQGEDCEFAFVTKSTQSEMDFGKELRVAFERGEAKCCLSIKLRRVGLIKRQGYKSASTLFIEPKDLD